MTITKKQEGKKLTVLLEGRLDTGTAPELEVVIDNDLANVAELIFDFDYLDYISSAGLRVILKAQKLMNKQGEMKLIHVNDDVMEVLEITGFSDILTILG